MAITPVSIIEGLPPVQAPGMKVERMLRRIPIMKKCNRLDAGDWSGYATDDIFNVPADCFVTEVKCYIFEAFTASVTITLGDGTDPNGFLASATIDPDAVGWSSSLNDPTPYSGGKYYATADTIDIVIAGATPTAGTIDVYVEYIRDWSKLGLVPG